MFSKNSNSSKGKHARIIKINRIRKLNGGFRCRSIYPTMIHQSINLPMLRLLERGNEKKVVGNHVAHPTWLNGIDTGAWEPEKRWRMGT
ncbi:MAG: hypothetical protein KAI83_08015 [Thiomargarita sp.]|nr:hypothetical protein [Thiomargarita sp.]